MGNQKETQKNPQYKYASTREKLCFGIGAIGKDAICNLVGAFLMLYFTDTLYLAPAFPRVKAPAITSTNAIIRKIHI